MAFAGGIASSWGRDNNPRRRSKSGERRRDSDEYQLRPRNSTKSKTVKDRPCKSHTDMAVSAGSSTVGGKTQSAEGTHRKTTTHCGSEWPKTGH